MYTTYGTPRSWGRTVKVGCSPRVPHSRPARRPRSTTVEPLARVIGDQGGSVATSALSASSFSAHRAAAWCPSYTTLVRDRLGLGLGLGFRFRLGLG